MSLVGGALPASSAEPHPTPGLRALALALTSLLGELLPMQACTQSPLLTYPAGVVCLVPSAATHLPEWASAHLF